MNLTPYTFLTPNGKMISTTTTWTGNMVYSTAMLIFLTADDATFNNMEYIAGLMDCEKGHIGAFSRNPFTPDNTSVDDYLAACSLPQFAATTYARSWFGFIGVTDGIGPRSQWLMRFQGFWQHMKISAGITVWPLGRFMWALSIWLAARQPLSNQDSWIQSHMMLLTKERAGWQSWIGDFAIRYWWKRKGSATTAEIMADYLKIPDHPLVLLWEKYL